MPEEIMNLFKDLSGHFRGQTFNAGYVLEDAAWHVQAKGSPMKPFRIEDDMVRSMTYNDILDAAIEHFEGDDE